MKHPNMKSQVAVAVRSELFRTAMRTGRTGTAAMVTGMALAAVSMNATASESLTFSSWGGAYQESQMEAMVNPAAERLGISVSSDSHTGLSAIQTQVMSGNVYWDVVDLAVADCQRGENQDLWHELDYDLIPNAADIPDDYKSDNWVGLITYSTVLGWNTDYVDEDSVPQSWEEFFDVEQFPGLRTMRNTGRESLEIALMADGVAPEDLYPLDVDRAYDKLAEIEPHVATWWTAGAQSAQLIADGSVEYSALWNGRVAAAQEDGAAVDHHWNQAIVQVECVLVPRGTDHPELAMRLINEMLDPEFQANFATIIPYGPANPNAYDTGIISDELAATLPTSPENLERSVTLDANFWASEEGERALERWERFTQE